MSFFTVLDSFMFCYHKIFQGMEAQVVLKATEFSKLEDMASKMHQCRLPRQRRGR